MKDTGRKFMEQTRYRHLSQPGQATGAPQPPLTLEPPPGAKIIPLPPPGNLSIKREVLTDIMERRRSVRDFGKTPVSLEELSWLLWCTQGVKQVIGNSHTFRTVPSAGACHALETWILANNVEGLKQALYHYLPLGHKLCLTRDEPGLAKRMLMGCWNQHFVTKCGALFLWSAVLERMAWQYAERSYRYLLLDAGHVCQNLYLAGETISAGVCAVAAFDDEVVNDILGVDGESEFAIYMAAAGKKG